MRSNLQIEHEGVDFNRNKEYIVVVDLGVTYGTIFNNVYKWISNDLKNVINFNSPPFISTQLNHTKTFTFPRGMLAQARKPNMSLKYNIDHAYKSDVYKHPSVMGKEAINFLDVEEYMRTIFSYEDSTVANNMSLSMSMKSIKIDLTVGIATNSRYQADNTINAWKTIRMEDYQYTCDMMVDFKIPVELIFYICDKFNIDATNHHTVLKFLNSNSHFNVFYAMDGNDAKYYYFIRYPASPIIKVEGLQNPQEWNPNDLATGDSTYTFTRNFTFEIMVPSMFAITKYGDRLELEDIKADLSNRVERLEMDKAKILTHERYIEIERVIDDKHALLETSFTWAKEDIIVKTVGNEEISISKKIDLYPFIDGDNYINDLIKWAEGKGYTKADLFNVCLYENPPKSYTEVNHLRNDIVTMEVVNEYDIVIPPDNAEYRYYLKNMIEFTIIDLAPKLDTPMYLILYISLEIKNKFEFETNYSTNKAWGNDDLGIVTPNSNDDVNKGYGTSKVNEGQDRY